MRGAAVIWAVAWRSFTRLVRALLVSLCVVCVLWMGVSVVRYQARAGGPETRIDSLFHPPGEVRHTAAYYVLADRHPLLAAIYDDVANPCLAHLLLLVALPILVVILWHWHDLVLQREEDDASGGFEEENRH